MILNGLSKTAATVGLGLASGLVPVFATSSQPKLAVVESSSDISVLAATETTSQAPEANRSFAAPLAAMTLLPNWLNSQGNALEFAQPLGRWLSALNPLARSSRFTDVPAYRSSKLPQEFVCAQNPEQRHELFSEWVSNCLLSEVDNPALRESMTERIETTFRSADWASDLVEPTLAENFPAARLGDRLLFVVNEEVTEASGINGEVLTTRWVNQLRMVMGAQPLTLVDAQFMMHGLKSTGDYLQGDASWYGPYFHGRLTATGEIYDQDMFTAAHKELPFDTYLRITNLKSGEQLVVRINDRGPYVGDRILDLSYGAANYLGSKDTGVVPIKAELLERDEPLQAQLPSYRHLHPLQDPLITMWRP